MFHSFYTQEMRPKESRGPVTNGNKSPRITESYHLENGNTFFYAEFNKMLLPRSIACQLNQQTKQSKQDNKITPPKHPIKNKGTKRCLY